MQAAVSPCPAALVEWTTCSLKDWGGATDPRVPPSTTGRPWGWLQVLAVGEKASDMVWLVLLVTVQLVLASEKQEGYDVEEGLEKYVRDFMNSYRSIKYLDRAPASPKQARLRAKVKKERKKIRTIKKPNHATKPGKEDQGEVGHRSQAVGHAYELGSYDPFPVWEYSGRSTSTPTSTSSTPSSSSSSSLSSASEGEGGEVSTHSNSVRLTQF